MKRTICKVDYDTDNATLISKYTFSYFGDPEGYEETLYQTPGGKYFLYFNGGEKSKYKDEAITRISSANAQKWLKDNTQAF